MFYNCYEHLGFSSHIIILNTFYSPDKVKLSTISQGIGRLWGAGSYPKWEAYLRLVDRRVSRYHNDVMITCFLHLTLGIEPVWFKSFQHKVTVCVWMDRGECWDRVNGTVLPPKGSRCCVPMEKLKVDVEDTDV